MSELQQLRQRVLGLRNSFQAQIDEGRPYAHLWYQLRVSTLNEVLAMIDQLEQAAPKEPPC